MADTFDPFESRLSMKHATSDREILMHVIKAVLGTGVLAMPLAFSYAGLFLGVVFTFFSGFICGHCAHMLVQCAHKLYHKERKSKMTYAEVIETAFLGGPIFTQKLAKCAKIVVLLGVLCTYFGVCAVYVVFVAKNLQQVLEHWTSEKYNDRLVIAALLGPILLLTWVPNLKSLAPFSVIANIFMGCALLTIIYHSVIDLPDIQERQFAKFSKIPEFFSIAIFCMQSIGVILPLENSMKTPTHFLGSCGVLSQGMMIVSTLCALIGFLGYLHYGPKTAQTITLNLPVEELNAQMVNVFVALAVYFSYGLKFSVCFEVIWDAIKEKFTKRQTIANYVVRTILSVMAVGLALAVPTIAPFMGLIGALFFSFLGFLMPVTIEIVMCLETGFGVCLWILWKDIVIAFFGLFALIFGTLASIKDIQKLTLLSTGIVALAIAVPTIAPFMGLIGSLFTAFLGFVVPALINCVLGLETGFGKFLWVLWKDIAIVFFGLFTMIFGTSASFREIKKLYQ